MNQTEFHTLSNELDKLIIADFMSNFKTDQFSCFLKSFF